jgi:hypothetical protein
MENQDVFVIGIFAMSLLIGGVIFSIREFTQMTEEKNGLGTDPHRQNNRNGVGRQNTIRNDRKAVRSQGKRGQKTNEKPPYHIKLQNVEETSH